MEFYGFIMGCVGRGEIGESKEIHGAGIKR